MENALERLKKIIIGLMPDLNPQNINIETDLMEDLMLDSITFIQMVVNIESVFDITIDDEYLLIDRLRKISFIMDVIDTTLSKGGENE